MLHFSDRHTFCYVVFLFVIACLSTYLLETFVSKLLFRLFLLNVDLVIYFAEC